MKNQDCTIGPGFQQPGDEGKNQCDLGGPYRIKSAFTKASQSIERGKDFSCVFGLDEFVQGSEQEHDKYAESE
jgi:hypothetical protein